MSDQELSKQDTDSEQYLSDETLPSLSDDESVSTDVEQPEEFNLKENIKQVKCSRTYKNQKYDEYLQSKDCFKSHHETKNEIKDENMDENISFQSKKHIKSEHATKKTSKLPLFIPQNNTNLVNSINNHNFDEILLLKKSIKHLPDNYKIKLFIILNNFLTCEIGKKESQTFFICLKILNTLVRCSSRCIFNERISREIGQLRILLKRQSIGMDKVLYLRKKMKEKRRKLAPVARGSDQ